MNISKTIILEFTVFLKINFIEGLIDYFYSTVNHRNYF